VAKLKKAAAEASPELYGTLRWTSDVPVVEIQQSFATLRDALAQGQITEADVRSLIP